LKPVSRPKKSADFRNTKGVMIAPAITVSIVTGPDKPMERKKPNRNKSLKPSIVLAISSALT